MLKLFHIDCLELFQQNVDNSEVTNFKTRQGPNKSGKGENVFCAKSFAVAIKS